MDAGPYYLGTGTEYFEREAVKLDFRHMVEAGARIGCPVILGSCGHGRRRSQPRLDDRYRQGSFRRAWHSRCQSRGDPVPNSIPRSSSRNFAPVRCAPTGGGPRSRRGSAARKHHRRPDGHPSPDHRAGERCAIHPCGTELRHRAVRFRHDPPQHRCGHWPTTSATCSNAARWPAIPARRPIVSLPRSMTTARRSLPRPTPHAAARPIRSPRTRSTRKATRSCNTIRRAFW